jgi:hypothetical protein
LVFTYIYNFQVLKPFTFYVGGISS